MGEALHADRTRSADATHEQSAAPLTRSERRVKVEAAKLRVVLDQRLGRATPEWVNVLAEEKL
ncbi:hypothetical protein BJ994_000525 [Arthrobacter pigmenti]|uniref:Uncharacterized protein n=1 Tax=Arthrobacter pigmenti TaxID=271432 RepID=A0A846RJY0_9MICC|nr:hypothetical protein [Arthrobacter pigmenti]NJC21449.1 hypothetical protein [Arthrobacter pigmenti]